VQSGPTLWHKDFASFVDEHARAHLDEIADDARPGISGGARRFLCHRSAEMCLRWSVRKRRCLHGVQTKECTLAKCRYRVNPFVVERGSWPGCGWNAT
jgi:hypothetical protein